MDFIKIISAILLLTGVRTARAHDMTHSDSARQVLQDLRLVLDGVTSQQDFVHYTNDDGGTLYLAQLTREFGAQHVCTALEHLQTDDLALFIQVLESDDLPSLQCKAALLIKYNSYLHNQSETLLVKEMRTARYHPMNRRGPQPMTAPLYVSKTSPAVHRREMNKGTFVLTFDDGPHPQRTPRLLDILDSYGIQALFFPVGKNVNAHPSIIKDIERRGHSIGGHTWSHPDLSKRSTASALKEVQAGFDALVAVLGFSDPFFRFPYMGINNGVRHWLNKNNIHEFLWAIDTNDWKYRNPETLLNYSLRQVDSQGRGIILFHDIQPQTIAMMPAFLEAMIHRGHSFTVYK